MFDWFEDLNVEALMVSGVVGLIISLFMFGDLLNVGMSSVPLFGRIVGVALGFVVGYFIADKMIG